MLLLKKVTKVYGEGSHQVVALRGIDVEVEPGEFISITGPSGCGKSTLLHLACGLDQPTDGQVVVNGRLTSECSDDELTLMRRNQIGLVFQSFNLIPTLTALENVVLPTTLEGRSFSSQRDRGMVLLDSVRLRGREDHFPDQLSGGEAQRVAIARALIMNPTILLADEPTGNLDSAGGMSIVDLLEEFGNMVVETPGGMVRRSTLIVTHDEGIAQSGKASHSIEGRAGRLRELILRYSFKHHLIHKFRLAMVLLSLALGVAIFVSSFESIVAAQDSVTSSANAMMGKTQWQVSRGRYLGVEESLLTKIRAIPGAIAAPIIESTVAAGPPLNRSFLVVGVDLDSDSMLRLYGVGASENAAAMIGLRMLPGMLVAPRLAAKYHLSSLVVQGKTERVSVPILGEIPFKALSAVAGGSVGLMELHQAQKVLEMPGRVDRIDVAGTSMQALVKVCGDCQITPPSHMSSAAGDALGRIHSLMGVSVIALLVGILLIYNSVQVSVLERLKDIAIIRSVGATRRQIFGFLLLEWLIIGVIGSAIGIFLGAALANALVEYTKKTINSMIPLMSEAHVHVSTATIVISMLIGVVATLVAAFFPIWAAANVKPLDILRPYSYRRTHHFKAAAIAGVLCCLVGNIVISLTSVTMAIGLVITGLVFLGVALVFPQIVLSSAGLVRPLMHRVSLSEPYLALDGLLKSPHRTAFTIMTFGCALAMTVATETLVEGFRVSTGQWMSSAFPFDISVMGNDLASSVYGNQTLPSDLLKRLGKVPGVIRIYGVRKLLTPFRGQDSMAIGVDPYAYMSARDQKRLPPWPPSINDPEVRRAFLDGTGTFVSANFASIYHVRRGERIHFVAPTGGIKLRVLDVIDDYSWPHGCFIVNESVLHRSWKDNYLSYIDISVAPGASVAQVKAEVAKVASRDRSAFAYDRQEIRAVTDSVLEQAVSMANMQSAIAVLIGTIGIVNAIWIGVMNRRREIALWRAIGLTRRQIGRIVLFEGFFVSIVSAVMAVIGGLYGGWVPLRSFSFDITGYLYPMVVPWVHVAAITILALVLGVFAGAIPAYFASRLPILESIGYE